MIAGRRSDYAPSMDLSMAHQLPDRMLLKALRDAVQQAQESVDRSRAIVRETQALVRLAERIESPLIESR